MKTRCFDVSELCEGSTILMLYPEGENKVIKLEIEIGRPHSLDLKMTGINFYAKTIDRNFI